MKSENDLYLTESESDLSNSVLAVSLQQNSSPASNLFNEQHQHHDIFHHSEYYQV